MLEKTKLMKLKDKVQLLEADHPDILDENDEFPSGTDITLQGTGDLKMKVDVGGNSTQETTTGKNWLDLSGFISKEVNGLTFSYQNGKLKINGTANALIDVYIGNSTWNANADTLKSILNAKNTTYYLSSTSNKISNYYWSTTNGYVENSVTTTDSNKISTIFVRIANGTTFNNELIGFQIEENSSATSWEKYTGGQASPNPTYKQDINNVEGDVVVKGSSKNLAIWQENTPLPTGTTPITVLDFGKDRTITDLTTSFIFKNVRYNGSNSAAVIDYMKNDGTHQYRIAPEFNMNINTLLNGVYSKSENNLTFRYVKIYLLSNYSGFVQGTASIIITENAIAVPYVPHAENTVTFPLSQGQKLMLGDTLEDDGIHHKRGQIVLNGTESISINTNYTTNDLLVAQFPETLFNNVISGTNQCLCSHFKYYSSSTIKNTFRFAGKFLLCTLDRSEYSTVEDFKTYLAEQYANGTPVIVEYELEIIDPYTPEQQTAYNKLKEMQSYYDLTYVVGSSDNAQPILTAHAKKSLKVMQSEIDELKQAILNS